MSGWGWFSLAALAAGLVANVVNVAVLRRQYLWRLDDLKGQLIRLEKELRECLAEEIVFRETLVEEEA